jgi:hypothetical protein
MMDGATPAGGIPETSVQFGAQLKALRGRRSLRRLETDQGAKDLYTIVLSKSQLARYEAGTVVPPLEHAAHLDRLYEGKGWVEVALRSLWRSPWDPWSFATTGPRRVHAVLWPAKLTGVVWLKIKASAENVGLSHRFELEWGPWHCGLEVVVPEEGSLIFTGKAEDDDGIPRTLNLTCDKRVFLLHGAGDGFDDESVVVDVRRDWRVAPS